MPKSSTPARSHDVGTRVTPEMLAALRRIASEDGATVSELLRRLLSDEIRKRPEPKGK